MSREFNKVALHKEGISLPPSLPLVLPSNYSFDWETQQLTENKDDIHSDTDMRYKLVPEAVKLLESIAKPVAVLSICGPYRSGKSYFLSRILGRKETFKLGHTMEACTRGIWMASSVLECDEFVLVLLDTEGIDAADKSNSGVANLLVLTMLLSSTFVYNSKNVPRGRDLKKMSYLTSLSRLLEGEKGDQASCILPEFVWLLRDVDCIPIGADGKELSPTEYLTSVLQRNKSCSTSSTLLHHFPTFRCLTISPPSTDCRVLSEITGNIECLSPLFNESVDSTIEWLLSNVKAKVGGSADVKCDGYVLACLIEQYFKLITKSRGAVPDFQVSWLAAIELRLKKMADNLVNEYDKDMRALLEGKLPIVEGTNGESGETLMNIHLQVFAKKQLQFKKELLSFHSPKLIGLETDVLTYFDQNIAEYDDKFQVIGGRLFNFTQQNIKSSETYCTKLYRDKYSTIVYPKLQNALFTQIPTTIEKELAIFQAEYYKLAKGPATVYIFDRLRTESVSLEADLFLIPGPVQNLKVVGADSHRVKLMWARPLINSGAVKEYVVKVKSKGKDWEVVATAQKTKCVVTGLQSSTWYCFMVLARSEKYTGNHALLVKIRTGMTESAHKALRTTAMVASPIALPSVFVYTQYNNRWDYPKEDGETVVIGMIIVALAALGTVPGVGQYLTHRVYDNINHNTQDLDLFDTDILHWTPESSVGEPPTEHTSGQEATPAVTTPSEATGVQETTDTTCLEPDCHLVDVPSDSEEIDPEWLIDCENVQDSDESD